MKDGRLRKETSFIHNDTVEVQRFHYVGWDFVVRRVSRNLAQMRSGRYVVTIGSIMCRSYIDLHCIVRVDDTARIITPPPTWMRDEYLENKIKDICYNNHWRNYASL